MQALAVHTLDVLRNQATGVVCLTQAKGYGGAALETSPAENVQQKLCRWRDWRGSNPRPLASEANTLSTELQSQKAFGLSHAHDLRPSNCLREIGEMAAAPSWPVIITG